MVSIHISSINLPIMLFTWAILRTEYFLVCISLFCMQKLPRKSERAKGESSYHMHTYKNNNRVESALMLLPKTTKQHTLYSILLILILCMLLSYPSMMNEPYPHRLQLVLFVCVRYCNQQYCNWYILFIWVNTLHIHIEIR